MAGVLPGVESARIRRFYQSNLNPSTSTNRLSFCLHAINHQEFRTASSSSVERNPVRSAGCDDDENLNAAASEAKKRLDRRLQTHWKSQIKRKVKGHERSTSVEGKLK